MPRGNVPRVTVFVPTPLRRYCREATELSRRAATVRSLLETLAADFPELHRCVCDETGAVRRHINVFVNQEHMRELKGVDTPLRNGDLVTIMTAVSGG